MKKPCARKIPSLQHPEDQISGTVVPVLLFLQGAANGTGLYTVTAQFYEQHLEVRPCRCQNSGAAQRSSWSQRPCGSCDTVFVTSSAFVTHHTVAVTVTRSLLFVLCSRCRIFVTSNGRPWQAADRRRMKMLHCLKSFLKSGSGSKKGMQASFSPIICDKNWILVFSATSL